MYASLPQHPAQANKLKTQNFGGRTRKPARSSSSTICLALVAFTLFSSQILTAQDVWLAELKLPAHFDPFATDAKAQYETAASTACDLALTQPAGFAGYRWRLPLVAAELRQRSGESPGKQVYIGFLKSKYGYQIAALNADYGTDAQSFTELLESPMKRGIPQHDAEFDSTMRADMLDGILSALRKCDPKHAEMGIWLLAGLTRTF